MRPPPAPSLALDWVQVDGWGGTLGVLRALGAAADATCRHYLSRFALKASSIVGVLLQGHCSGASASSAACSRVRTSGALQPCAVCAGSIPGHRLASSVAGHSARRLTKAPHPGGAYTIVIDASSHNAVATALCVIGKMAIAASSQAGALAVEAKKKIGHAAPATAPSAACCSAGPECARVQQDTRPASSYTCANSAACQRSEYIDTRAGNVPKKPAQTSQTSLRSSQLSHRPPAETLAGLA